MRLQEPLGKWVLCSPPVGSDIACLGPAAPFQFQCLQVLRICVLPMRNVREDIPLPFSHQHVICGIPVELFPDVPAH